MCEYSSILQSISHIRQYLSILPEQLQVELGDVIVTVTLAVTVLAARPGTARPWPEARLVTRTAIPDSDLRVRTGQATVTFAARADHVASGAAASLGRPGARAGPRSTSRHRD